MAEACPAESAYIHTAFCASKCAYCDFNSFAGQEALFHRYTDAVCRHIRNTREAALDSLPPLRTVFFGGGTPTVLPTDGLVRMLQALRDSFGIRPDAEITLEANPESAAPDKLAALRDAGFNRISLGVQSFDDAALKRLGRIHTAARARQAVRHARRAGFANLSLDLMFGLPGQDMDALLESVRQAIELGPEHISAYCLSIEPGTPFASLAEQGELDLPDEDLQADMLLAVGQALTSAGYEHYEISNFARAGCRCAHNLVYWRREPYWAFGAGAVAFLDGWRIRWQPNPLLYAQQVEDLGAPEAVEQERLEGAAALGESVMLGLRLLDGLDLGEAGARFGLDALSLYADEVRRLADAGLLERSGSAIRLTSPGLLLANEVMQAFVR